MPIPSNSIECKIVCNNSPAQQLCISLSGSFLFDDCATQFDLRLLHVQSPAIMKSEGRASGGSFVLLQMRIPCSVFV